MIGVWEGLGSDLGEVEGSGQRSSYSEVSY